MDYNSLGIGVDVRRAVEGFPGKGSSPRARPGREKTPQWLGVPWLEPLLLGRVARAELEVEGRGQALSSRNCHLT